MFGIHILYYFHILTKTQKWLTSFVVIATVANCNYQRSVLEILEVIHNLFKKILYFNSIRNYKICVY